MSQDRRQVIRPAAGGMLTVDIAKEIVGLKAGPEWQSGDRHAVSLVKDEALNVLLMVLKNGAKLREHHTKGPIAVQLLSGSIRFTAGRTIAFSHRTKLSLWIALLLIASKPGRKARLF
jgi:hypothetical protein